MQQYLEVLGHKVRDAVTGFEGVADSVCFDLYGCIQVSVMPPINTADPDKSKGRWYDHKRLVKLSDQRVLGKPVFAQVAGQENGPAEKAER